jgi:hypothetical protein
MRKIELFFRKALRKALTSVGLAASVLGLGACDIAVMYGPPEPGDGDGITITGRVKSAADQQPIMSIEISITGIEYRDSYDWSDKNGDFVIFVPKDIAGDHPIQFRDIDGPDNGGYFESKDIPYRDVKAQLELNGRIDVELNKSESADD